MGALRLALTPGEPAGIGPDLAVRLAQTRQACELVAVGDPEMLAARARLLDLPLTLEPVDYARAPLPAPAGVLQLPRAASASIVCQLQGAAQHEPCSRSCDDDNKGTSSCRGRDAT